MKKILTIVALALVVILGATVITLAFVKTDYDQLTTANVESIVVYYGTANNTFSSDVENDKDIYNKLISEYNKGTKETVLSSLFQGSYASDAKPEVKYETWTFSPAAGKNFLKLNYSEGNYPVIKINGEVYEHDALLTAEKTVEYKSVYVQIEDSSELTKITAYFVHTLNNTTSNVSNYRIQFVTHHESLNDYVVELYEANQLFN